MLCQPNAPEPATVLTTDDVTHRMLCCQTDIRNENIAKPVGFTQNNVKLLVQIMVHRWHQKLRHCLFVDY